MIWSGDLHSLSDLIFIIILQGRYCELILEAETLKFEEHIAQNYKAVEWDLNLDQTLKHFHFYCALLPLAQPMQYTNPAQTFPHPQPVMYWSWLVRANYEHLFPTHAQ